MDKNNIIGLVLIFIITMGYLKFVAPSPEEVAENQRIQDSIQIAQNLVVEEETTSIETTNNNSQQAPQAATIVISDSLQDQLAIVKYGAFAAASNQSSETVFLENEKMKVTFSSKGGKIVDVLLKDYKKITEDTAHVRIEHDLHILEDKKNKFEYLIPYSKSSTGILSTADLNFTPEQNGNTIIFRAQGSGGEAIIQSYTLLANDSTKNGQAYTVDYNIELQGMGQSIPANNSNINLHWVEYLDKIELNTAFEKTYSTTYFKVKEENADDLSATSDDDETISEPIEWISHSNQFFNASLIPTTPFKGAKMQSTQMEDDSEDLKLLVSDITIPLSSSRTLNYPMKMYLGPNEFENLREFGNGLEDVIPYGWSIFGTINRWVIRPLFDFLASFIGSMGISIIVMTLIVKLLLYPLTYKMLHSQAKMSALKPEIAKMKEKHKDDSQKTQMETMKLYREYGVNPLGGCMPMILQMPIWFALYRFFPAAIAFRQKPFWWATDLSSYDVMAYLPFEIPMVGAHISLFTILWAITTLIYTYYNSKMMDMSANPAMKYMQYVMPIMFLGFFNNYAAGLTAYLFFSNLINITQTLVTKKLVFSDEKLRAELHLNKAKPKKKKSGFQARLEDAMKEQQRIKDTKKNKK